MFLQVGDSYKGLGYPRVGKWFYLPSDLQRIWTVLPRWRRVNCLADHHGSIPGAHTRGVLLGGWCGQGAPSPPVVSQKFLDFLYPSLSLQWQIS